ncbi:tRNA (adenosine(37)-N6)-threonylcarbamoyltransferase complex ATPase subunit type 1 TsaE [Cognatilysobacter bugurensis]|uniref:tRNA threonylcarbamoyladenosine biosynthesis protein TsaE n=1 Tax=Cognatilysobacter bugurensis TaxID=543356 RepID=A0A918SWM6_9GAMM|nr:tRNA (adenosine(37)-N6)-threonylcarbamoyltransferase complex ATPase subunit type 1 TsaE [Lysobacter bugurensis]GHA74496.1 tRNA (adenosine(37)-N6)-threonylcarbamoyltransferase complex ATPase subunit type 1 TsaE [Lysobacter bugurensis]
MTSLFLADPDATDRLGAALAESRPPRAVVHLLGDLGAGKSSLARAMLRALGVVGTVRSPTYTLVERYPLAEGGEAWHLDLYRIGDPGELEFLGLDSDDAALWLVEWPDRGAGALPVADLVVRMEVEGGGRRATLHPCNASSEAWLTHCRFHMPTPE